jgi:hypothetical protein
MPPLAPVTRATFPEAALSQIVERLLSFDPPPYGPAPDT